MSPDISARARVDFLVRVYLPIWRGCVAWHFNLDAESGEGVACGQGIVAHFNLARVCEGCARVCVCLCMSVCVSVCAHQPHKIFDVN
jgi:hypothetical protein